jgi:hypothetical protein
VDGDAGLGAAQDVVGDGHVLHRRPWRRAVLVARAELDHEAALRLLPAALEQIAVDDHPARVLELEQVLHRPSRAREVLSITMVPGERLGEVIAANLDVGGREVGQARIAASEHDVLARRLQIVVDDLERPRPAPSPHRLRVFSPAFEVGDVGVDDGGGAAVERDAAAAAHPGVPVDVAAVEDEVVGQSRHLLLLGRAQADEVLRVASFLWPHLDADEPEVMRARLRVQRRLRAGAHDGRHGGSMRGRDAGAWGRQAVHGGGAHYHPARAGLVRQREAAREDGARLQHDLVAGPGGVQGRL